MNSTTRPDRNVSPVGDEWATYKMWMNCTTNGDGSEGGCSGAIACESGKTRVRGECPCYFVFPPQDPQAARASLAAPSNPPGCNAAHEGACAGRPGDSPLLLPPHPPAPSPRSPRPPAGPLGRGGGAGRCGFGRRTSATPARRRIKNVAGPGGGPAFDAPHSVQAFRSHGCPRGRAGTPAARHLPLAPRRRGGVGSGPGPGGSPQALLEASSA